MTLKIEVTIEETDNRMNTHIRCKFSEEHTSAENLMAATLLKMISFISEPLEFAEEEDEAG